MMKERVFKIQQEEMSPNHVLSSSNLVIVACELLPISLRLSLPAT